MLQAAQMEARLEENPEEFDAFVAEYRTRAFRFLLQMVGNYEDALDLLQEGWVRLYKNWDRRDPDRPFAPWMYRILRNVAIDHLRKRKRQRIYELDLAPDGQEAAGVVRVSMELRVRLWRAINDLPEEQKEAVVLREMHGLSYAEIADVTGDSVTAITMRLHHARQRLREQLRGCF